MSDRDRLNQLELEVRTIFRQIAGMPVRIPDPPRPDNFRLIRGQSVGIQTAGTVLIDNVVVLAGGLDPSHDDATAQVRVANRFSEAFDDNQEILAVYSRGIVQSPLTHWETLRPGPEDTFRRIRGLAVGAVDENDVTFLIDNVVPLASGTDPVAGNPATQIRVANIWADSFKDNQAVVADYHAGVVASPLTNWEANREKWPLAIVAQVKDTGGVQAEDTSFIVDNVYPVGGGISPVAGAADEITVTKSGKETFRDDDLITAVWNGAAWELLIVERFRAVRGKATSTGSTSTFNIDNIVPLDSGHDPRTDPTSTIETLAINNVGLRSYTDNEDVWADYNAASGEWDRRPTAPTTANVTSRAIVTDAAGNSTHGALGFTGGGGTVGKAVLLDEDGAAVDANGDPFVTDLSGATAADKIEFKSEHRVAVPINSIIRLSSNDPIQAGTTWDGVGGTTIAKVWGEFIDPADYWAAHTSHGQGKMLWAGSEASPGPADMEFMGTGWSAGSPQVTFHAASAEPVWQSLTCVTFVTAVNCVANEIVETNASHLALPTCTP